MTTALATSLVYMDNGQIQVVPEAKQDVRKAVLAFLDMASTATGQKTYYNKKSDQQKAMRDIHDAVFDVNRGLYLAMLSFPGVLDVAVQEGITKLLKYGRDEASILTANQEAEAIKLMSSNLKATRLLKMFKMFKDERINKGRVRALVLSTVLGSRNLAWWAVKYRNLVKDVLRHAWGNKYAPVVVRAIKSGDQITQRDGVLLRKCVDKYTQHSKLSQTDIYESVCFVFGAEVDYKNDLFKAFFKAREDLSAGKKLPPEVLEGIRGRYHKNVSKDKILELTKNTATDKQKLKVQRQAKEANVKVEFDPTKLDVTSLYVYALEEGMTNEVRMALDSKASYVAAMFPLKYRKVAVVVDTSASMGGTEVNKNRPLAISLAMRDVLSATGDVSESFATNGEFDDFGLVKPVGDTSLALAVAKAFQSDTDVIYIITDGYENAPAGRVHEVIDAVRELGIETPVYQFNPVMATEAAGVRSLSSHVSTLPVSKPEGIGLSLIRAAIEQDIGRGLQALVDASLPRIAREG